MSIKSYCRLELYSHDVIRIYTLLTTVLILIIRILVQSYLSFLIESSHFNFGKWEVIHNEETI